MCVCVCVCGGGVMSQFDRKRISAHNSSNILSPPPPPPPPPAVRGVMSQFVDEVELHVLGCRLT